MPVDTLKAARRLREDDTFSAEHAERIDEVEHCLGERSDRFDEHIDRAADERRSIKEQLTDGFEVRRIARLECRLPVGDISAVAAIAALLNDLMGSRCRAA